MGTESQPPSSRPQSSIPAADRSNTPHVRNPPPAPQSITCRRRAPGPRGSGLRDVAARASVRLHGGPQACSPPQGASWREERCSGTEEMGAVKAKGLRGWPGDGKLPAPKGPSPLGAPNPRPEPKGRDLHLGAWPRSRGRCGSRNGTSGPAPWGRGHELWGRALVLGAGLGSGRDSAPRGGLFFLKAEFRARGGWALRGLE